MAKTVSERDFNKELKFSTSRSSGPGGQNVNKVNTRVELRFNVKSSEILTEFEKEIILGKLKSKISLTGDMIISSQSERTQLKNKEKTISKFNTLIIKSLLPRKKRIPTKPTIGSAKKKLENKRRLSEKKTLRKNDLMKE
jgi:ribosome-associated protein